MLSILLVFMVPAVVMAHEFYISITTIQHHPETQKLSIRVKIFVNDFEESIYQEQGVRLGLGTDTPVNNSRVYIEQYVCSKLFIVVNSEPIALNYLHHTLETAEVLDDHVIICYLDADNVQNITSMKVFNSLLTEAFDTQTNIVNIRANATKFVINLDKKLPEDLVFFD